MNKLFPHFFPRPASTALLIAAATISSPARLTAAEISTPDYPTTSTPSTAYRVETVAEGLEVPWSMAFAPDGRLFVAERPGRLRIVENGKLRPKPASGLEEIDAKGEIGLMSVALHPDFDTSRQIYLSHGYEKDGRHYVRITRYREEGGRLSDRKVVLEEIPAKHLHAGCRIVFAPDRSLYVTTGDAGTSPSAQRLDSLLGKVLRVNDKGRPAEGNPFLGKENARPEIFSFGHRNPQGLAWQPGTGRLFLAEHGPSDWDAPGGGDEVNVLEPGSNYGWPVIHHRQTRYGMQAPWGEWTPATAPGGIAFYNSSAIAPWQGNLFVACLKGECLQRLVVGDSGPVAEERLFEKTYGRIREVTAGPDGTLYFATSNRDGYGEPRPGGDRILRIVPGEPQ